MICSRRLYKGNSYEICLPLTDTGVTLVRFYTRGDVIIEKEPEITGDSMCFSFTVEELASLEDGVLRYEVVTDYESTDTNAPYVVVTPGDYSGSTLDDLLEEAFDSGYTAGMDDCSGGTCEGVFESGYTSGYSAGYEDGSESVDCMPYYESGKTDGEAIGYEAGRDYQKSLLTYTVITQSGTYTNPDSGWSSVTVDIQTGHTDQEMQDSWDSGYTSGKTDGYESGYTAGQEACSGGSCEGIWEDGYDSGYTDGSESVDCTPYYESGVTDGYQSGYTSGHTDGFNDGYDSGNTDGFESGYDSGYTDGAASVDCTDYYNSGVTDGFGSGYTSGYTVGYDWGRQEASDIELCKNLAGTEFRIPDCTARLRPSAFRDACFSAITIPDTLLEIGDNAFGGNTCLVEITLPDSIIRLGESIFAYCTSLSSVTLPNWPSGDNMILPAGMFWGCTSLSSITIPDSVNRIGASAFYGTPINNVELPDGLISLGRQAFGNCGSLTNIVIPDGVTIIEDSTFHGCTSLTSVTIPSGIISIGVYAFSNDPISSITIPQGVSGIGQYAFLGTSLTSATVPAGVEFLGINAFGTSALTYLVFEGDTPPTFEWGALDYNQFSFPIYVPCSAVDAYKAALPYEKDRVQANPNCSGGPIDYNSEYFTVEPLSSGTFYVHGTPDYSINGGEWEVATISTPLFLTAGDQVRFRGFLNYSQDKFFSGNTLPFKVYGNIESLEYGDNFSAVTAVRMTSGFTNLFLNSTGLVDAENLVLPATTLQSWCYYAMFKGCTNLVKAPTLPATNLQGNNLYHSMFEGCTSLVEAPVLIAEVLTTRAYESMFSGCTNLSYVKCPAKDISASNCLTNWLSGVASTGVFEKDPYIASWPSGPDGIPTGWTVIDIS